MNITYCMLNSIPIILGIDNQSIIQIYKSRGLKGLSFRVEDGYLDALTNEPTGIPTRLGIALGQEGTNSWTLVENYTTHEWFQELQDFYNQCLNSYKTGDIVGNEINPKDATLSIDSSFLSTDINEPVIPDAQSIQEYRTKVNTTVNAQEIVEPTISLHLYYVNDKPSKTQAQLIKNTITSLTSLQIVGSVKQFPPDTQNHIEYITNLKPTLPPNTHVVCFTGNEIDSIKLYCDMYGYEFPKYLEAQSPTPQEQSPQPLTQTQPTPQPTPQPNTLHFIISNPPTYAQDLVTDIINRLGNPTFNGNTNVSIILQGSVSDIVTELQDRLSKNTKLSSKAEKFVYIQGVNYNSDLHLALQVYNTMYNQNIEIPQIQEQTQQEQPIQEAPQPVNPTYKTVLVSSNTVDYGNNLVQELQAQLNTTFTIIANIDNYSLPNFDTNTIVSNLTQALQQSNNPDIERVIFIAGTDYNSDLSLALQVYNAMYNQEQASPQTPISQEQASPQTPISQEQASPKPQEPLIYIANLNGRESLLVDYFQNTFNTTIKLTQEPTKATHVIKPSDIKGSKWRGIITQISNIYSITLPEDEDDLPIIYTNLKQNPPAFILPIPIGSPVPLAYEYEYYLLPSMSSDKELELLMELLRTPRDKTSNTTVVIDINEFKITREWVDFVLANKFASVILVESLGVDLNNPTWRDTLSNNLSTTNKLIVGSNHLPNEAELFKNYYNPQVQVTPQELPTPQTQPTPQEAPTQELNTSFGNNNTPTTPIPLDMANCPYKLDNTYSSVPKEVIDKLNNPKELYAIMTEDSGNSWVKSKLVPFFNFNIKNLINAVHSIGCLEKLVSVEPTIPIDKETLVHNGIHLLIWLFKLLKEDIQLDSLVTMFNALSYESGEFDVDFSDIDNDSSSNNGVAITFQSNIDVELYTECKELYVTPIGRKIPINITKTLFKDMDEDVIEIIDFSNFGIPSLEVELGYNSENILGHYTYYINGNLADRGAINGIYNDVKNIIEELTSLYTGNLKPVNNMLHFENGVGHLFNQWVHSLAPRKELENILLYQNLPDRIKPEVLMGMKKYLSRLGTKISDKVIIDYLNENNIEHTVNDDCTVTITKGLSVLQDKGTLISLYNYILQNSISKGYVKSLRDLVNGIFNLIYRNPYYLVKFVAQDLMSVSLDLMNMTVKGTSGEEYLKARVSSIVKYNERKSMSFKEVASSKSVEPSPLPKSEEIVAVVIGQLLDDTGVSHHLPLFVLNRIMDNINNTSKCILYPIITNEYDLSNSFRDGLAVITSREILPTEANEVKAYCIATLRNSPINSSTVTSRDFVSMEVSSYITNEGLATLRTKLIELKEAKR